MKLCNVLSRTTRKFFVPYLFPTPLHFIGSRNPPEIKAWLDINYQYPLELWFHHIQICWRVKCSMVQMYIYIFANYAQDSRAYKSKFKSKANRLRRLMVTRKCWKPSYHQIQWVPIIQTTNPFISMIAQA
jgi:hypothetical protein